MAAVAALLRGEPVGEGRGLVVRGVAQLLVERLLLLVVVGVVNRRRRGGGRGHRRSAAASLVWVEGQLLLL
jgi:hypothetical protein